MHTGRRLTGRSLSAALLAGVAMMLAVGTSAGAATAASHPERMPTNSGARFDVMRPAGSVLELTLGGHFGVPTSAEAVALNITVAEAQAPGFITVYPCGIALPTASNVNYLKGSVIANAVVATLGDAGKVCIYTYASTHLIVDLNGYFPRGANYTEVNPARLLDTRSGYPTADGAFAGGGLRPAGSVLELPVAGRGGVPLDAKSVVLNVTVAEAQAPGFVTVFPCGTALPTASNVNYLAGSVIPNAVIAKVGAGGSVCLFTYAATHLIVDVNGYFPPIAAYTPLDPARLLDTRPGYPTVDGQSAGGGMLTGGSVLSVQVVGRGGVPADTKAVVLNVTVADAQAPGFISVFPCGNAIPTTSNVNYVVGSVIPNAVFAKIGVDGKVCLFAYGTTHVVVDLNGYFPNDAAYTPLNPGRILDTRVA
jgi:hypothetical protein